MSVVGIYCKDCGKLIGARETVTNEHEYAPCWCGIEEVESCWGCYNPFDIPVVEDYGVDYD